MYIGRYSSYATLQSRFTPEMRNRIANSNSSSGSPNNYDKLASISGQPVAVAKQQSGRTVITNKGTPTTVPQPDNGGCKKKACPPPPNKSDIIGYWNQASCEFENLTCGALPSWGFSVIVGLGGVLLIGLLTKRR
jgi:hypothetical protein